MKYLDVAVVVQSLSRVWLQPHGLQHARLPCPSLFPGVCSNSCPLSQWCHLTISSSVIPFSCCMLLLLLGHFSHVRLYVTPQTSAHQVLLPLGFSRQEYWSGVPVPSLSHVTNYNLFLDKLPPFCSEREQDTSHFCPMSFVCGRL